MYAWAVLGNFFLWLFLAAILAGLLIGRPWVLTLCLLVPVYYGGRSAAWWGGGLGGEWPAVAALLSGTALVGLLIGMLGRGFLATLRSSVGPPDV